MLGSVPGSAAGGEGGGDKREAGGYGIGGGVIGPSGGLEGGAGMLFLGSTAANGVVKGKNCGRRWGFDDLVFVPARGCVFESVGTLTERLAVVAGALSFLSIPLLSGCWKSKVRWLKVKADCGTEGSTCETGTSCFMGRNLRRVVDALAKEDVSFGLL